MEKRLPKSAYREYGKEQPGFKVGIFTIRLPFIHTRWELPEMFQALVVFVTGVSAAAFLQDIFGLPFNIALSIVVFHEFLYLVQNLVGDPLVGGWVTPAIPLVTAWLLSFNELTDRIQALIALQLVLGSMFILFGVTGLATKFVKWVPNTVKAGILIGSSIAAVTGRYGFKALDDGGIGFYKHPITFSVATLIGLFILFSPTFNRISKNKNVFVSLLSKSGFVSALLIAYIVGMVVGEVSLPNIDLTQGLLHNPFPGLKYAIDNFSIVGLGVPSFEIISRAVPISIMVYIIAFSDIVAGTQYILDAKEYRPDEDVNVNPNLTNISCGIRNIIQSLMAPTVTMSGPLWSAMMVTISERYKTGIENMHSLFGGSITFNLSKLIACFILPLVFLVQPIFPLAMSLTLLIQAFAGFYIGMNMVSNNVERGVAGVIGGVLAITDPLIGLVIAIIISITMGDKKRKKENKTSKISTVSEVSEVEEIQDEKQAEVLFTEKGEDKERIETINEVGLA